MSDKDRGVRVESCIFYTKSERFCVRVLLNTVQREARFDTLAEARKYRDDIRAMRPKREKREGAPNHSAVLTQTRAETRAMLKNAPRAKVKRNGREFTLVRLPEVRA